MAQKAIIWFKNDLRIGDNPCLIQATKNKESIIPVFIWDPDAEDPWQPGAASKLWLHHSLKQLNDDLAGNLVLLKGNSKNCLKKLISETAASKIYWSRRYEPSLHERDEKLQEELDIETVVLNSTLVFNPDKIFNKQGGRFKVFTPFYKHCLGFINTVLKQEYQTKLINKQECLKNLSIEKYNHGLDLDKLELLAPYKTWQKAWQEKLISSWTVGEDEAIKMLLNFNNGEAKNYGTLRDRPDEAGTSKLSPYLHFGQISPLRIWKEAEKHEPYTRQVIWREFAHYIMHHFPHSTNENLKKEFDKFPWEENKELLEKWQKGKTGFSFVDAGMRELYETGWMHNRTRMVVGSFLIKDLFLHWKHGAAWFWDTLFDASLANNSMGWQWVAGSGVDASPFFRIFNPMTQAEKFDPQKKYRQKWIKELETDNYASPIVNHDAMRKKALEALKLIKK